MPEKKQTQTARQLKDIEKCPAGIRGLNESAGAGLPRGQPTLIWGGADSGKTGMAAAFADAAWQTERMPVGLDLIPKRRQRWIYERASQKPPDEGPAVSRE